MRMILALFSILAFSAFAAASDEMEFKSVYNGVTCPDCNWILAQGKITRETPDKFRRFKNQIDPTRFIYLHSEGGDLAAAIELGRLIRETGASVSVRESVKAEYGSDITYNNKEGSCLSACAYAFLGGTSRSIEDGSVLGFHQFFDGDILSNLTEAAFTGAERLRDQYVVGFIINYLIEMDISTELYPLIAGTAPGEMRILSREEAVSLRVDNSSDPDSGWRFVPYGRGLVSEFENPVSGRRVRLYCSDDSAHLAFFFRNNTPGEDADWAPEDLFPRYPNLSVRDGNRRWKAHYNLFSYTKTKSDLIFVFDIPKDAALSIAESGNLSIYPDSVVPRSDSYFLAELDIKNISGDPRIPKIALRNCI